MSAATPSSRRSEKELQRAVRIHQDRRERARAFSADVVAEKVQALCCAMLLLLLLQLLLLQLLPSRYERRRGRSPSFYAD
jgi:hypothetical protein